MIHKPITAGLPGTGAANTQRASPGRGKLPFFLLIAIVGAFLLAATALADTPTRMEAPRAQPVPTQASLILLSAHHNGEAETDNDQVFYRDEDIVSFVPGPDPGTGDLDLYFDGSDVGLAGADLEDFEVLLGGSIIFTIDQPFSIPRRPTCSGPDPLVVDDSDIVRFIPSSLGTTTEGCFELYLAGSAIGLTKGNEDIDALALAPDGRLLISTIGNAKANGSSGNVEANDEDLLVCTVTPPTPPPGTPTCELYFDGSDIKLTNGSEDLLSAWVDPTGDQNHYLTTKGNYKAEGVNNLSGQRDQIIGCTPISLDVGASDDTDCFLFQFFDADDIDWENQIDGLWVSFAPPLLQQASVVAADSQAEDAVAADDAINEADFVEAMSLGDTEVDAYDFIDVVQLVYLPLVNR